MIKPINVRAHTRKALEISRRAANGTFPTPEIARMGSYAGMGIGILLSGIGVVSLFRGSLWGWGLLTGGAVTTASNAYYQKRIPR